MRRLLVKSLLIFYSIAQLALPIGGHDATVSVHGRYVPPHFHLSILDGVLGLEATGDAEHARIDARVICDSNDSHHGDAVYLPSEASLIAAKDRLAFTGPAICSSLWISQAKLTSRLAAADGRMSLLNAVAAADVLHAAIQRWQI